MNGNPQLLATLKQLHVSGIMDTLDLRAQQAADERLSFPEFLERVMQDELERRMTKQLALRVRRANFQSDKTLQTFDFAFNPTVNRQQIIELAGAGFVERKQNILITGPSGVGKSHLAHALGWEACKRGYEVLCSSCAKLLVSLAAGRADGSYQRRIQAILRPDLLILDDFGLKPLRPPAPEDFYDIINERYDKPKSAIILTSNRALSEFPQLFGDPLLASAGLDRLFDNTIAITLTGASFRARNRSKLLAPTVPKSSKKAGDPID